MSQIAKNYIQQNRSHILPATQALQHAGPKSRIDDRVCPPSRVFIRA
jgi:hypothetical protein